MASCACVSGVGQEGHRIVQARLGHFLELVGQRLHRDLGGDFAVHVAAHAIRHHHQQRIAAVGIGHPILVVFAAALT